MPESAPSRLPQEILDTILENLCQDSQSLRQCALAARCLLPIAQRVIFRTICLTDVGPSPEPVDRFHRLLELSPHLAKHVTEATIRLRPTGWGDDLSGHPLSLVIPQLHSLRRLSLSFEDAINPITFHRLHTLLGGISIPRISSLRTFFLCVAGIGDLARICEWLAEGGGLQELQFGYTKILDATSPVNTGYHLGPATTAQLRTLTCYRMPGGNIDSFLQWAISSKSCLRFDELRELTVGDLTDQSSKHLLRILHTAKSSIRQITFGKDIPCLTSIPFQSFSALRTIAYTVAVHEESSLREWTIILAQNKDLPLDSLIVNVNLKPYRGGARGPWTGFLGHPWKEFEAAFMNSTKRKKLELHFGYEGRKMDIGIFEECFPLSHTPGHVARERLVMKQNLIVYKMYGGEIHPYEYRPGYGEWKEDVGTVTC